MYLFVTVSDPEDYYREGPSGRIKARLEQASGERCLIVPYRELDLAAVEELRPRAIVTGGFGRDFVACEPEWFFGMDEVFHKAKVPTLCFCGTHQILGLCFNQNLRKTKTMKDQPMRKLGRNEELPRKPQGNPEYNRTGYFVADGFYPIRRVAKDPLFTGLPETMMMMCAHYCEVRKLPTDFALLASSGHCRIEAMRHRDRPLYGLQFHPEAYAAPFFHGRKLLGNFAKLVDRFWKG